MLTVRCHHAQSGSKAAQRLKPPDRGRRETSSVRSLATPVLFLIEGDERFMRQMAFTRSARPPAQGRKTQDSLIH
jgi:hypothetical protein